LIVGGISGDDVFFGQFEGDGLLGVGVFSEEAFDNGRLFKYLCGKGGRDEGKSRVGLVLDVHV
jgi:hypothetical protein